MSNARYNQFFYTKHNYPVQIDCLWTVAPADTGGLGITGLVGPGIRNVYMRTTATAAAGNPNPASGYIYVVFQDNFKRYYASSFKIWAPSTGSALTSGLTVGVVYQINALGSSTLAQWRTAGVPVGQTPAVGLPFVAQATSIAGGGSVLATGFSGVDTIEGVGNPQLTLNSTNNNIAGQGAGSYLIFKCSQAGAIATPTTGSTISMKFLFSNSSILVQGA